MTRILLNYYLFMLFVFSIVMRIFYFFDKIYILSEIFLNLFAKGEKSIWQSQIIQNVNFLQKYCVKLKLVILMKKINLANNLVSRFMLKIDNWL